MGKERNDNPFLEKFMLPPDDYEIFKFGGSSLKDEKRGIKTMLKYFSSYFTEEQLKENMASYNLQTMFDIVKKYFAREYGYTGAEIELSNIYQNSINSYIYNDRINPVFVHIDELFESTVMGFLLAMFKWSKDFENLEIYGECFKYVLFLMNDVCIFGEMQDRDANQALMDTVNGDIQILQLAEDCYWTIVIFSLAHELAHAYLAVSGKKYTKEHPENEEYDADMIAYHIVLKIIMEEKGTNTILEEYTYLAPMIYMDFLTCIIIQTEYCIKRYSVTGSIRHQQSAKIGYLQLRIKMNMILILWMEIIYTVAFWMCMMSSKISFL